MNRRQFNLRMTAVMLGLSAIPQRFGASPQSDAQKPDRPAAPSGALHSSYFFKHPIFEYVFMVSLGRAYQMAGNVGQRSILARAIAPIVRPAGVTKKLVPFSENDGADLHCEPKGTGLRDLRVFNWLDETLA